MSKFAAFLQRKNIVFSARRYGIDALGAMAQGLFCSLLIGTIVKLEGSGDNEKATVEFRNAGTKQLLLKFAKFNILKV